MRSAMWIRCQCSPSSSLSSPSLSLSCSWYLWSRWHCARSGEAKRIQNTIIGNLYSEYHQKLCCNIGDIQLSCRICVHSESLEIFTDAAKNCVLYCGQNSSYLLILIIIFMFWSNYWKPLIWISSLCSIIGNIGFISFWAASTFNQIAKVLSST